LNYQVIIPCAGTGSRLGSYTNVINKALVSIDNQPIISKIISQFPKDCQFIIPLGYKGEDLENYLKIAHNDIDILIKYVDPYEGENSGLGTTLLNIFELINKPFVFTSCDTLVTEKIPAPTENWIGYSKVTDSSSYRTIEIKNGMATKLFEKQASESLNAYIGLAGFKDYEKFKEVSYNNIDEFRVIGESYPLSILVKDFKALSYSWSDTGNIAGLQLAREIFSDKQNKKNILEKENEKIWFINNKVIKFSTNEEFIKNRVTRAIQIKKFVPKVNMDNKHMYSYDYVDSSIISQSINSSIFEKLLNELDQFWELKKLSDKDTLNFELTCHDFYFDKTFERINSFLAKYPFYERSLTVNGISINQPIEILNKVDWAKLSKGIPSVFHGDLHFENILFNGHEFKFLDWRDSFGGLMKYGDIYYDLAKLLHGILVSHKIVLDGGYRIQETEDEITLEIDTTEIYKNLIPLLSSWVKTNGYDINRINILTALIFINIAPLHHDPYSRFLYFYGISNLNSLLEGRNGDWLN
tara:strand:+ start:1373 stop:2950 length:1578 start_codon:yes stop_codon:yes gene_type:complete